jgi:hypothetical protein
LFLAQLPSTAEGKKEKPTLKTSPQVTERS